MKMYLNSQSQMMKAIPDGFADAMGMDFRPQPTETVMQDIRIWIGPAEGAGEGGTVVLALGDRHNIIGEAAPIVAWLEKVEHFADDPAGQQCAFAGGTLTIGLQPDAKGRPLVIYGDRMVYSVSGLRRLLEEQELRAARARAVPRPAHLKLPEED